MKKTFSFTLGFIVMLALVGIACLSSFIPAAPAITEAELGKALFFDPILSAKGNISCASCHKPAFSFSDTVAFSVGDNGKKGKRNAPALTNLTERDFYFYDGRALTLEHQALFPIADPLEMNLPINTALQKLNQHPKYQQWFLEVYSALPDSQHLGNALAAYVRTLETSNSAWDRYAKGDKKAISAAALRGRKLFNTKGKCFDCHRGVDFTNDEFRNIGLYNAIELNDMGRAAISGKQEDAGKFKVPGLRNVAVTAPYMHNGMFRTLREVLDYYNNPSAVVSGSINTDSLLNQPLGLTTREMDDLEAFLNSLTDEQFLQKN